MKPESGVIRSWRENPAKFVWDNFHTHPDKWQLDALKVFPSQDRDKIRMSLQACAGPGKSAALAWCGLNFLGCYSEPGNYPKGACVSVTSQNLQDNLWVEYAKWMGRSKYLSSQFSWNRERISHKVRRDQWFLSARSWSKTASVEEQGRTLSGLHSKYVLVQIDESGDIPISVAKAADQAIGNCTWGKIMQAGNPTSLEGMLYIASKSGKWHVIRITGDPDDPKRSPRIDIEWARDQISEYGRDDPWVMAYILGLFPPSSINTLFGPDLVEECMARHLKPPAYSYAEKRLGVDVARFGDDLNVLAPRQGLVAFKMADLRNARGPAIAARIKLAQTRWGGEIVTFVDDTGGWGGTVEDSMLQAGMSYIPVCYSGKADDPRYYNKRAEMWFRMSQWAKRGAVLPWDMQLKRELCAPTYTFQKGKFLLEPKDRIKKRLGCSPNKADALGQTFCFAEAPANSGHPAARQKTHVSEWDPIEKEAKIQAEWDPMG